MHIRRKRRKREREGGPREWLLPLREATYARLAPRSAGGPLAAAAAASMPPGDELWVDRLAAFKQRKAAAAAGPVTMAAPGAPAPFVPGGRNWRPLGPTVVLGGQAVGRPPVGGRVSGIAVAADGQTLYAATANGGVFRSDDAGVSWRSLMDGFDLDPTNFASTSLASGAIALHPSIPDRIYVGTGEGDTHQAFADRVVSSLPAYRGIGAIRSDDGGRKWVTEPTAAGSPTLAGKAFFALAVDPNDGEHVVGATTDGLYERTAGVWRRRKEGVWSSVIAVVANGATRFYAAQWGEGVFTSSNGANWTRLGSGFPINGVARIALAAQPRDPRIVYAFIANGNGILRGLFRLDIAGSAWAPVRSVPNVLPVDDGSSQGDYDLAIAVDPLDHDIVYLGGSYYFGNSEFWPASIWRCEIRAAGASFRATCTPIGEHAHADVHVLVHAPGDPNALWAGCDGGAFLNRNPRADGTFASRNSGLACLCPNFIAQHPTDPNILFAGLQDNGTARTSGNPEWKWVNGGDGGYCLFNWANPKQVLVFANGTIYRATDGGNDESSWTETKQTSWASMTEPIVGPPYNPAAPSEAKLVAVGSGADIHLSQNFGSTWPKTITLPGDGVVFALTFASAKILFAGTSRGEIYRIEKKGTRWMKTRIDDAANGMDGLVTDIAVDWSDATRQSIYVAYGGSGDYRHVWHFDGAAWTARSGPPGNADNLLDVEHNALAVDRDAPQNVYAGADIGVWHSTDAGTTWAPLSNGLPDAPVFDLQIHPTRRLLRAATHGRGVYELEL